MIPRSRGSSLYGAHQDDESSRLLRESSPFYSHSVASVRYSVTPEDVGAVNASVHSFTSVDGGSRSRHLRQFSNGGLPERYGSQNAGSFTTIDLIGAGRHSRQPSGGLPDQYGTQLGASTTHTGRMYGRHSGAGALPEHSSSRSASSAASPHRQYGARFSALTAADMQPTSAASSQQSSPTQHRPNSSFTLGTATEQQGQQQGMGQGPSSTSHSDLVLVALKEEMKATMRPGMGAGAGMRQLSVTQVGDDWDEEEQASCCQRVYGAVCSNRCVMWLLDAQERLLRTTLVAMIMDVLGSLLYIFDMYTDIKVVATFANNSEAWWLGLSITFITFHFFLMAILVCAYVRRVSGRLTWWLNDGDKEGGSKSCAWFLLTPLMLPAVLVLDMLMLVTSLLPALFPSSASELSSFLSNYNFSRLFVEFVFESVPQTVLQSYVVFHLLAVQMEVKQEDLRTVIISLVFSAISVCKYSYRLWRAADDAGMRLLDYFKYVLLLKGNYECSPAAMDVLIDEACTLEGSTLTVNGFNMYKAKSRFGPAQQAYVLLNAFQRFKGLPVTRLIITGCPLPSINRILERGLVTFPVTLEALEVHECAFRGDNLSIVTRKIKKHPALQSLKIIQSGALRKYKNHRKDMVASLFKAKLRLKRIAICVPWWDATAMQRCAKYIAESSSLESLALEFPDAQATNTANFIAARNDSSGISKDMTYAWSLASVLVGSASLRALYLHNHPFSDEGVGILAKALTSSSVLTSLSLRGSCVGDSGAIALAQALKANEVLQTLNLRRAQLHAEGLTALATSLSENHSLTSLDLSQNRIEKAGVRELARALRLNSTLQSLKLEEWLDTFDSEAAIAALTSAVACNKGLTALSMAGTRLGTQGAAALGPALATNAHLRSLDLSCSRATGTEMRIGEEGVAALARGLVQNGAMTELNLKGSIVGPGAAAALADMLLANDSLQSLDLGGGELGDEQVQTVCAALCSNTSLTSLSLTSASLAMPGMRALADALRAGGGHLRKLDLSFAQLASCKAAATPPGGWTSFSTNAVYEQGEQELQQEQERAREEAQEQEAQAVALWSVLGQALACNNSLQELSLAYTGLTDSGATLLAAALQQNGSLRVLDVAGYSAAAARRAFQCLQQQQLQQRGALQSIRATGENFAVVNILAASGLAAAAAGASSKQQGGAEPAQQQQGAEPQSLPLATLL